MPEQLTKHPEVTLQVLASAGPGVQCGAGAKQEILTSCPAPRFCKLPGGEMCIYGLPEAGRMTQMGAADWRAIAQSPAAPPPPAQPTSGGPSSMEVGSVALLVGLVLGFVTPRLVRKGPTAPPN